MSQKPFSITAPNLPIPPASYTQTYQDQFNNILRLFFNQITNFIAADIAQDSGTTVFTVAQLPSAATSGVGVNYTVTDANSHNFYDPVVGGGTFVVPVYSDGSIWRIG